eukprot:scpid19586/ scgid0346/ Coiled-coil domain-containing protein 37
MAAATATAPGVGEAETHSNEYTADGHPNDGGDAASAQTSTVKLPPIHESGSIVVAAAAAELTRDTPTVGLMSKSSDSDDFEAWLKATRGDQNERGQLSPGHKGAKTGKQKRLGMTGGGGGGHASHAYNTPFTMPPPNAMFGYLDALKEAEQMRRVDKRHGPLADRTTFSSDAKHIGAVYRRQGQTKTREINDYVVKCSRDGLSVHAAKVKAGIPDSDEDDDENAGGGDDEEEPDLPPMSPSTATALESAAYRATAGQMVDRERIVDFVQKKREIFLLEYSLKIKNEELAKLDAIYAVEEGKLYAKQQQLRNDFLLFQDFLKLNDGAAMEAIKKADEVARSKRDTVNRTDKVRTNIVALRNEISKNDDQLELYLQFANFLESVAPKEWRQKMKERRRELAVVAQMKKRQEEAAEATQAALANTSLTGLASPTSAGHPGKDFQRAGPHKAITPTSAGHPGKDLQRAGPHKAAITPTSGKHRHSNLAGFATSQSKSAASSRQQKRSAVGAGQHVGGPSDGGGRTKSRAGTKPGDQRTSSQLAGGPGTGDIPPEVYERITLEIHPDEEPELFFKNPRDLLDIYADLEERNLSLIQNGQETEEVLEALKQKITKFDAKMMEQVATMKTRVKQLHVQLRQEQEAMDDLKLRMEMFSHKDSEGKEIDTTDALAGLEVKVASVYKSSVGINEANITSLQMLTAVEAKLHELFDIMSRMPAHQLADAERMKDKERRQRQKDEQLAESRRQNEERLQKALDRAKAAPKKQLGRRAVFRSRPSDTGADQSGPQMMLDPEEEENMLLFT